MSNKPDRRVLKPINVYEAELIPPEAVDILSAATPRYIVVYHHLNEEQARKIHAYLDERLKAKDAGSITLPVMGRMI